MKAGYNRLANVSNRFQNIDKHKRVLTVCSAGLLRSPTAACVLSGEPYNFNTKAVGISPEYALIIADEVLIAWADEIVFMEDEHKIELGNRVNLNGKVLTVLDIPDNFEYRDPLLILLIREKYNEATGRTNV